MPNRVSDPAAGSYCFLLPAPWRIAAPGRLISGRTPQPPPFKLRSRPCVGESFAHLLEVTLAGAVDKAYADQARAGALACRTAAVELRRIHAPSACVGFAQDLETLQWQMSRVLTGDNQPGWKYRVEPLNAVMEGCAAAGGLQNSEATPGVARAAAQADAAAKAASEAERAELNAMRGPTK